MSRGIYRTVGLAAVACAAMVYCAMAVFGVRADTMLHYFLFSVFLVVMIVSAAALTFVLRQIFRGSR